MGFLDKLLGREKKAEDMPAEPQTRSEGTQPDTASTPEPPPGQPEGMGQEPGPERDRP